MTSSLVHGLVSGESRQDVAAALQAVTENVVLQTLSPWLKADNPRPLLLAGGLFANIRVNGALMCHPGVTGVFVFPNMGDGGLSAGAAHVVWRRLTDQVAESPGHWFLGPEPSQDSLERAAAASGRPWRRVPSPARSIASRIAAGQIVARYSGRDEFGPRALGNRSILFSATTPGLGEQVNRSLDRDDFMPFGPAVTSRASDLWSDPGPETDLSTMTVAVSASPRFSEMCPGAVHIDKTTRPQVVDETNPDFFDVLEAYRHETGIPAVINTSFNRHGEPVVHSPSQAVDTFQKAGLDALYLDDIEVEGVDANS